MRIRDLQVNLVACFFFAFFSIMALCAFASGCGGSSVRDLETYSAEIVFIENASLEQVERGIALIKAECRCQTEAGIQHFTTKECFELAETVLVIKHRMLYHTSFMKYLGGMDAKRPPATPPPVPEPDSLCKEIQ